MTRFWIRMVARSIQRRLPRAKITVAAIALSVAALVCVKAMMGGLADKAKVTADYLSGGEQQRVAILRAVAHRPKLVLMDEPTSCLDSHNADRLIDLVMQMHDGAEAAILTTTHDPRMAARFRRSLRISDGRLSEPEQGVSRL